MPAGLVIPVLYAAATIKFMTCGTENLIKIHFSRFLFFSHQIDGNEISNALLIAHDCMKYSFPHSRHNSSRPIPIVNPTAQRLIDARQNCNMKRCCTKTAINLASLCCNLPIEGRTIATGKLPASFSSMLSARAFVKVYVFGRLPISDGVNCNFYKCNYRLHISDDLLSHLVQKIFRQPLNQRNDVIRTVGWCIYSLSHVRSITITVCC
jgi:hypothetical protein